MIYDYLIPTGRYGKGHGNSSGKILLELCAQNELIITNTLFQHKLTHRTTWTAPMRKFKTKKDGSTRINPVRNQIDYILTRKNIKHLITDSRSYGGITTDTDHKIVIATINIKTQKIYKTNPKNSINNLNMSKFQDHTKKQKFKEMMSKIKFYDNINVQNKWNHIVKESKKAGKQILGMNNRVMKNSRNYQKKNIS